MRWTAPSVKPGGGASASGCWRCGRGCRRPSGGSGASRSRRGCRRLLAEIARVPSASTGRSAPSSTRAPLIDWAVAAGRVVALPVVVDKKGPLEYRAWQPGEPLVDGVWNIPVPEKREIVMPAVVLAPLVGFDRGVLSARLWRRLFRPHAGGAVAAASGDRRRVCRCRRSRRSIRRISTSRWM